MKHRYGARNDGEADDNTVGSILLHVPQRIVDF